ncbi:hypothetical protein [Paenibacillus sp. FSL H8-0034]|uniref:hypothetical protein n=1 Tax=Paenibacillus sp. FSL H8-0034 TaxID=2954671 RepID=UPI0030F5D684
MLFKMKLHFEITATVWTKFKLIMPKLANFAQSPSTGHVVTIMPGVTIGTGAD